MKITKRYPANPVEREEYMIELFSAIETHNGSIEKITRDTLIKGASIAKLCQFGAGGYKRVIGWLEQTAASLPETSKNRSFGGQSTRDSADHKLNYINYFYPDFLVEYGKHMKIGEIRHGSANFKHGMPAFECLQSLFRHTIALWHELEYGKDSIEYKSFCEDQKINPEERHEAACVFNAQQIWKWKGGKFEEKLKNNK